MIQHKATILSLLILFVNLPCSVVCSHDEKPSPNKAVPSAPPTYFQSNAPTVGLSVAKSVVPTVTPVIGPASVPTIGVVVARYEVEVEGFSILLGPLKGLFSDSEVGLIEQVSESHLQAMWNERLGNDDSIISLNIVNEDIRRVLRGLQSTTSERIILDGTLILFSDDESAVDSKVVNQFIVLQAFEGKNGDDFLASLNTVLGESDLRYVSASAVEISPAVSPVTDTTSNFWDEYGLYIIIACCALATVIVAFGIFRYAKHKKMYNESDTYIMRKDISSQDLAYSRTRFFQKATNDLENELNTSPSPDDKIEFKHNLHDVQDPSSFKFNEEVEYKQKHYYAVRNKFNANFTDTEMARATAKGHALASEASIDIHSPSNPNLRAIPEASAHTQLSNDPISPLENGSAYGNYIRNIPKIKLQPSDEETIESPPSTPKSTAKEQQLRRRSDSEVLPVTHQPIQEPGTPTSVSQDACLGDIFSNYLCGVQKSDVLSPLRKAQKEVVIDAPEGKLGVYLDGSNIELGHPCAVHDLKPNSVLKGKLLPGDLLISINDKDVRKLEALEVSRLLSRSNKKKRRIVVLRNTPTQSRNSGSKIEMEKGAEKTFDSIVTNAQNALQKQRSISGAVTQNSRSEFRRIRSGKVVTMTADYDSDESDIVVDVVD